jgi:hypothetical protein
MRGFGVQVADLGFPVTFTNGVGRTTVTGTVNRGALRAEPVVDLREAEREVVLHNPTNLMVGVELTDSMANELLGLIHPLFRTAAGLEGSLDLHMRHFLWPLDERRRDEAAFAGVMRFTGLKMGASGLSGTLLSVMKVRERQLDVGDREIRFVCERGRVACSPMRFEVDGQEVVISGSMGLDGTLDYVAQIPLSESLVGASVYKHVEGVVVRLPVRGTATQPDLGVHVLEEAVADALGQAAQKAIGREAGKLLDSLFR